MARGEFPPPRSSLTVRSSSLRTGPHVRIPHWLLVSVCVHVYIFLFVCMYPGQLWGEFPFLSMCISWFTSPLTAELVCSRIFSADNQISCFRYDYQATCCTCFKLSALAHSFSELLCHRLVCSVPLLPLLLSVTGFIFFFSVHFSFFSFFLCFLVLLRPFLLGCCICC